MKTKLAFAFLLVEKLIVTSACAQNMDDLFMIGQASYRQDDMFNELSESEKAGIYNNIAATPIAFRKNEGQWDNRTSSNEERILYQGSSPGWNANIYFMKHKLSFGFMREKEEHGIDSITGQMRKESYEYLIWNLHFKGANPEVNITAEGKEGSRTNYLIGNDFSKHVTNVSDYRMIKYNDLYENIDLRYYSTGKNFKYDYILKPGSDISKIQMTCEGIKNVHINGEGQLEIKTTWGTLVEEMPESYQIINGGKKNIKIIYRVLNDTTFGFNATEEYNRSFPVIIDPIIYKWGTYLGSTTTNVGFGYSRDITVDSKGYVYGTSFYNLSFPTTAGVYDQTYNGASCGACPTGQDYYLGDIIVYKLKPDASALVWATYIGGSKDEWGVGIAVDEATNEVIIRGMTSSSNFPTTAGAYDNSFNGVTDAVVCKLNATAGNTLIYSTYIGGTDADETIGFNINDIGYNQSTKNVYVVDYTLSTDFPMTPGCYDPTYNGGGDAVVFVLNPGGNGNADLKYASYLGGTGLDRPFSIGYHQNYGKMAVTGITRSTDYPVTVNAHKNTFQGGLQDAFMFILNPAGSGAGDLIYSTYVGGSDNDYSQTIHVNSIGESAISGFTNSNNFSAITAGSYDPSFNTCVVSGNSNIFMVKFNPIGNVVFGTFFGDGAWSAGNGIWVTESGEVFLSGEVGDGSGGCNIPTTPCAYDNSLAGSSDQFLAKFNASGSNLLYATYIGGGRADYHASGLFYSGDCSQEVYIAGASHSFDFPVTAGVVQPVHNDPTGLLDKPVVYKFKPVITPNFTNSAGTQCNSPILFTDLSAGNCIWKAGAWLPTTWQWSFGDGGASTQQNPSHIYTTTGTYTVKLIVGCPMDSIIKTITVTGVCGMTVTATTANVCSGSCAAVTSSAAGGAVPYTYLWNTGSTAQNINPCPVSTTTYTVTITDAGGITATSTAVVTVNPVVSVTATPTNISCSGTANGSVLANPGSGTSPYTYNWSNGQATQAVSGLSQGNYTVTVTDNKGCKATAATIIISPPVITGQFAKGTSACTGCGCKEWILVSATGGTSPYSYSWPDGYVNRYKNQLCPGTYSVNIKDKNGCSINVNLSAP
ncbi:MAG: PKD domain-containing protein [Bacteroidetes bacterium]|nr:PKD domain-containing protein [Bacteroidota bacterium]